MRYQWKVKKRLLQIIVSCLCISQLNFLSEIVAQENLKIKLNPVHGTYFQKDLEQLEDQQPPQKEEEVEQNLKEPEVSEEIASFEASQEIVEERTMLSRTYKKSDGTYLTEQYFEPIFKEENGEMVEIDDTLNDHIQLFSGEKQFYNEDGLIQVAMNESSIYIDDKVTFTYPNMDLTKPVSKQNAVLYNDTDTNQDMQITVRSDKVFQEIKFEEKPETTTIKMHIDTDSVVEKYEEAIIFKDDEGNEEAIFKSMALEDSTQKLSLNVSMDLESTSDGYDVTYTLDENFFNEETNYPVTLRGLYDARMDVAIDSGYIRSGSPNQTSTYSDLLVGYDTWGKVSGLGDESIIRNARTFVDFDMPSIGNNQIIEDAQLILTKKNNYAPEDLPSIYVFDTNEPVNPEAMTWNTQPSNMIYVSEYMDLSGLGEKAFDITKIIEAMYSGKDTSIMLMSSDENSDTYFPSAFFSESVANSSRPKIQISHRDDYDVDPGIGINDFQAKFRFFTAGYNNFKGFSMDGIAKPYGNVKIQLYEKNQNTITPVTGKQSAFYTEDYFIDPIFIRSPLSYVQTYPDEDVNYTTDYFTRDYFPKADTLYLFKMYPYKAPETGLEVETDNFIFYKVKLGDNLKTIAAHYDTTIDRIKSDNNTTVDKVKAGDEILIRYPKEMPTLSKEIYTPPTRISTYDAKFKYRGPACYGHCFEGDPINTSTGNFYHETTDFTLNDFDNLEYKRTYNSLGNNASIFGDGFSTPFEQYIAYDESNNILFFEGDGKIVQFPYSGGTYRNIEEHTISVVSDIVTITNTTTSETMRFNVYGMLESITSKDGHKTTINYDANARITGITIGNKSISFEYVPDKRLVKAITLPDGNKVQYEYSGRRLTRFVNANGESEIYHYDGSGKISSITDRNGTSIANNVYDSEGKVLTQKDGKGQTTKISYTSNSAIITYPDYTTKTYTHNSDYKISAIVDENNEKSTFTYSNNRMTSRTDKNGKTTYEYNGNGDLTKQVNPDGTSEEYTYDSQNNLTSKKDASGKKENFTYDGANNVTSQTDTNGNKTIYEYDGQHRIIKETDVFGVWKKYTYEGNLVKTITHSNGLVITFTYDSLGNLLKESDNNGRTTTYQYNKNNQVIRKTNALNESEEYQYDGNGNMIRYTNALGAATTFVYDANNNQIQSSLGNIKTSKTYDSKNRIISETDEQGKTTVYKYDGAGNKVSSIDNYGKETKYKYNAQGDLIETIDPKGNVVKEEYDKAHRQISSTDALGNTTKYVYDANGLLTNTIQPNGKNTKTSYTNHKPVSETDEFGNTSTMEYDSYGRMTKKTDSKGNVTETKYNAYGQAIATITNGKKTTNEFDVYGNVIKTTDPYGVTTTKTYDALNRNTTETDALGNVTRHVYNATGNEIETINANGYSTKKEYNLIGQCVKETDENGNVTTYAYNEKNQNVTTWKSSVKTTYQYNVQGDMVKTFVNDKLIKEVTYDGYGRSIKEITPEKTMTFVYDNQDRVIEETNETTGLKLTRTYDEFSNVLQEEDNNGRVTKNTYDDYHRLIETEDAYGRTQIKTYDDFNNVIEETSYTNETTKREYDERNNLIKTIDANGNETINTYDDLNRLLTSTFQNNTTTYTYDTLGRTIETHTSINDVTTYTTYDAVGNVLSQSDLNGYVTSHTYDGANQELSTTDPKGNTTYKEYDAFGNITKETDALGNTKQTRYNAYLMPEVEVDERGFTTTYVYDDQFRLKETIGKLDETTSYTYDEHNQVSSITDGNGNTTHYEYDLYGNTIKETNGRGISKETTYDVLNNPIETIELNERTVNTYDEYGRLTHTYVNEIETLYQAYDDHGRIIEKYDTGVFTKYEYDIYGNTILETSGDNEIAYTYDDQNRVISKLENEQLETTYTYDNQGNETSQTLNGSLISETTYDENGNVAIQYEKGLYKQYIYDEKNQVIYEQYRKDNVFQTIFTYTYDEVGNVIETKDVLDNVSTNTYDANNQVTSESDANGHTTKYEYDCLGNLIKVQNALDRIVMYDHDENYNVTKKQIGDVTATYEYDDYNRIIQETNEYGYEETFEYDIFDNIISYTKPNGDVIEYAYDEKNQKIKEGSREFKYDDAGNLIEITRNDDTITFAYDDFHHIIETQDIKGRTTKFTYDDLGNQTSIEYDDGTLIEYTYNDFRKIDSVIQDEEVIASYRYDEQGNQIQVERKGIITNTTYDELSREIEIVTTQEDTQLSHIEYTYDGVNNITSETIDGNTNTYTYDEMDELKESIKYQDGEEVKTTYGFDFYGNQTEKTSEDETRIYEYNENQQLTKIKDEEGITNIHYDDNGNMETIFYGNGEKERYTYDEFDQLIQLEKEDGITYTYGYDPQGDRVNYKKLNEDPLNQDSWYSILDDIDEEKELENIKQQREETFETFKEKLENADIYKCTFDVEYFQTQWYQSDAEQIIDKTKEYHQVLWQKGEGNQIYGNTRLYSEGENSDTTYIYGINETVYGYISNIDDKQYIKKNTYEDYGHTPGVGTGYGYNGEFRDESGLIYLRARYYNPKIARFIQIDSFKGTQESIESQNRYIYVLNNPYKYSDPSGNIARPGFRNPIKVPTPKIFGKSSHELPWTQSSKEAIADAIVEKQKRDEELLAKAKSFAFDSLRWLNDNFGLNIDVDAIEKIVNNLPPELFRAIGLDINTPQPCPDFLKEELANSKIKMNINDMCDALYIKYENKFDDSGRLSAIKGVINEVRDYGIKNHDEDYVREKCTEYEKRMDLPEYTTDDGVIYLTKSTVSLESSMIFDAFVSDLSSGNGYDFTVSITEFCGNGFGTQVSLVKFSAAIPFPISEDCFSVRVALSLELFEATFHFTLFDFLFVEIGLFIGFGVGVGFSYYPGTATLEMVGKAGLFAGAIGRISLSIVKMLNMR